jgi:hypothetical protein
LCSLLIVPEVGLGHLRVDLDDARFFSLPVKESLGVGGCPGGLPWRDRRILFPC